MIMNQLTKQQCDSVLCVGTPSLFERIRAASPSSIKNTLLLDIDERLVSTSQPVVQELLLTTHQFIFLFLGPVLR